MTFDVVGVQFYNEFIPCVGGSDFNQENVDKMMKGWRALNISDDLLGAWGYVPASDTSRFDNGWWELSWESKEAADAAWAEWVQDEEAMAFLAENESVMVCDGAERASWDFLFIEMSIHLGLCQKMDHSSRNFSHANTMMENHQMT